MFGRSGSRDKRDRLNNRLETRHRGCKADIAPCSKAFRTQVDWNIEFGTDTSETLHVGISGDGSGGGKSQAAPLYGTFYHEATVVGPMTIRFWAYGGLGIGLGHELRLFEPRLTAIVHYKQ